MKEVRMMKRVIFILPIILSACSSSPAIKGYEESKTLATVNGRSQPDWADETVPFKISNGKVYSVGVTTIKGDQRPEAGARIAENNARAIFAKTIENRMEFIFQNSEENSDVNSTQAKYIGSEASNLTSHSMTHEGMWWIRFAQSEEDGSRRIYYKIYSLVTMPEADLKKAVESAIQGSVAQHKLSESFQGQVNKQWNSFVNGKETTQTVAKTDKESE
jgi:hypothetical protein